MGVRPVSAGAGLVHLRDARDGAVCGREPAFVTSELSETTCAACWQHVTECDECRRAAVAQAWPQERGH